MILLPLAWTLFTGSLWTLGSSQLILQQEPVKVLYPAILSTEAIECNCADNSCDSVSWFRSISKHNEVLYLGNCNNADRVNHGAGVDEARFKLSKKNSMSFLLRVINVTEKDAGIYSCVIKARGTEIWKPGIHLRPGVTPPTLPPKTKPKPPVKSVCRCSNKDPSHKGCGSLILWPLVGLVAGLALALICTMFYFSRLPKKCRHHFVKKRQMS